MKTRPMVVFDENGKVVGICDPKDVQPLVAKSATAILAVAVDGNRAADAAARRGDLTPVGMMLEKRRNVERATSQLQRLQAEQRTNVLKASRDRDSPASRRRHGLG